MAKKKININDYRIDELYLKIPIKNKKGIYSKRIIKIENVYKYNLTSSGLNKKSKESIQKLTKKYKEETKKHIRVIREKDRQKKTLKDLAKELKIKINRERKKEDKRTKKEAGKEIKVKKELSKSDIKKAKFNYNTINHTGYKYERHLDYIIDEDTTLRELDIIRNDLVSWSKEQYTKLPLHLRFSYVKIEYIINRSGSQLDDISSEKSSKTTKISPYKYLITRLNMVIDEIFELAVNYASINIYKQTFVNYEFNSVIY